MSKQKGKSAAKKSTRKVTKKAAPVRRTASVSQTTLMSGEGRTAQATIVIFFGPNGPQIRTTPARVYAGPGAIEWTILNLVDGTNVPVTLTWPEGSPWGNKEPIEIRNGMLHRTLEGASEGRFKYVVSALGATEDPEVEIPEM